MPRQQRWDIFCRVVDNFGDIGVCWRLAKQLTDEYELDVCLWVDDFASTRRLLPALDTALPKQRLHGVNIRHWQTNFQLDAIADVVIEAFACELPQNYLLAMAEQKPIWLNLEYLSAENWVEDCHLQPSPHPRLPLKKTFFFPGFTKATGGLLREHDLLKRRHAFQQKLTETNVSKNDILKVSLFCYPCAPITQLLSIMAQHPGPTHCYIPQTSIMSKVCEFFSVQELTVGQQKQSGNLTVEILPFLSQDEYDQLLWSCDLNFVRGEDSWIRAIWAGKPFIWQPYQQQENTHLIKLHAFFDRYRNGCDASAYDSYEQFSKDWVNNAFSAAHWQQLLQSLPALQSHAVKRADDFAQQPDLAAKLVIFCKNFS